MLKKMYCARLKSVNNIQQIWKNWSKFSKEWHYNSNITQETFQKNLQHPVDSVCQILQFQNYP